MQQILYPEYQNSMLYTIIQRVLQKLQQCSCQQGHAASHIQQLYAEQLTKYEQLFNHLNDIAIFFSAGKTPNVWNFRSIMNHTSQIRALIQNLLHPSNDPIVNIINKELTMTILHCCIDDIPKDLRGMIPFFNPEVILLILNNTIYKNLINFRKQRKLGSISLSDPMTYQYTYTYTYTKDQKPVKSTINGQYKYHALISNLL